MKTRVLIYGFSGKILGGIETFILNMNEHMSRDTIFDYIIDGEQCVYQDRIEDRGGNVFFVPGIRQTPFEYIKSFRKILKEQRDKGTRIIYIQLFSMANMLPVFIAKMCGYVVILHAHNNGLHSKSKLYKLIHNIGKALTRHGNYVRLTNSQLSSDFMFGKGVKSELIYNAIDLKRFSFHPEWRESIRDEMTAGNNTVVGFVGRFSREKNPLYLLDVFNEYHQINQNSELWIVGEGELRPAMEAMIVESQLSTCIKWLGRRDDVARIMCGMDFLLQPSLFEGLGIVLIEGQATGLPCVSSAFVIPEEAKATQLIKLMDLSSGADNWAKACANIKLLSTFERMHIANVFPQHYNIDVEATKLEKYIVGFN